MRTVAISAADTKYFHLLKGLVLSWIEQKAMSSAPLVVLDVGLTNEERAWLSSQNVGVVAATPVAPAQEGKPKLSSAQRQRPLLPRLVPGYDLYLWVDADIWLQSPRVVPLFLQAASQGAMAIVPEVNVAYRAHYDPQQVRGSYASYKKLFDKETADKLAFSPTINSGFFALRGDQPHWERWDLLLGQLLTKTKSYYTEQFALNYVLYGERLPTVFLPSWCNWICHQAKPVLHVESGQLLEPVPPYAPLGAIHLTINSKEKDVELHGTDGQRHKRSLKYRGGAY